MSNNQEYTVFELAADVAAQAFAWDRPEYAKSGVAVGYKSPIDRVNLPFKPKRELVALEFLIACANGDVKPEQPGFDRAEEFMITLTNLRSQRDVIETLVAANNSRLETLDYANEGNK